MSVHAVVVMLPRDELARRAAHRLDQMLASGAIAEVEALLARHLPPDRPVLRALGVREIGEMLAGHLPPAQAQAAILMATTAYQKRQTTWARNRQRDWPKHAPDKIRTLDDLARLPVPPRPAR